MQPKQPGGVRIDRQGRRLAEHDQRDCEYAAGESHVHEERRESRRTDPWRAGGDQLGVAAAENFSGEEAESGALPAAEYEALGVAWRNEEGQLARVKLSAIPISWDGNLYFRSKTATDEGAA